MHVLVQPRPVAPTRRGGDWLQLQATVRPLRALGVQVDISTDFNAPLFDYDVCLIWNSVGPVSALRYFSNAQKQSTCVALMPFYWRLTRFWEAVALTGPGPNFASMRSVSSQDRASYYACQAELFQGATAVLPNSASEAGCLISDFPLIREKIRVIPNGVDADFAGGNPSHFRQRFREQVGERDFILCVAQIAPRKNQLSLLRALRDDSRLLVFMGTRAIEGYAQACDHAAAVRGNVIFLERQHQDVVAGAFAAARVHALVSTYDVAPLVTMEAAIAGVPQVAPTECGIRDYLGDGAWYAEPDDLAAICRAVDDAWNAPRAAALAARIAHEFTWERTACELATALEWALTRGATGVGT